MSCLSENFSRERNSQFVALFVQECHQSKLMAQYSYLSSFSFLVPPYIDQNTDISRNIRIIKGRQLTLLCPAMGTPYPDIKWYKNGFPVSNHMLYVYSLGLLVLTYLHQEPNI